MREHKTIEQIFDEHLKLMLIEAKVSLELIENRKESLEYKAILGIVNGSVSTLPENQTCITKEEMILMRAMTWIGDDANDGCVEAIDIINGLKDIYDNPASIKHRELLIAFLKWRRGEQLTSETITEIDCFLADKSNL